MIVGRKVRLRRPPNRGPEHDMLCAWRNDPANKPFFCEEEPISLDSHLAWWDSVRQDPCQRLYLIESLEEPYVEASPGTGICEGSPILIGTTGLRRIDWRNRTAEYTWLLLGCTEYRGGGFGKEAEFLLMDYAFNHLNLNKVWGVTLLNNEVVLSLHRKMGFKEEGKLRQQVFKGGKYVDLVRIGLLAKEFSVYENALRKELGLP